jgi:guanine deaminase
VNAFDGFRRGGERFRSLNVDSPQNEERYLAKAIELAISNVDNEGGPFGALVVTPNGAQYPGVNRVTSNSDPTAHAEVMAIRNACSSIKNFDLSGAALYPSCEPCPLCLAAALWARIDRVIFAADRYDAASAGFDDAEFYRFFEQPVEERSMLVKQLEMAGAGAPARNQPCQRWNELATRIAY